MSRLHFSGLLILVSLSLTFCGCDEPRAKDTPSVITLETNPFIQNEKLARSINLGNMLEAPAEGDWGLTLQADYFTVIAEAGFTAVRLPIRWSAHADTAAPYTIDPIFLDRVDWAVDQALDNNLAIVLNVHHYLEMMADPASHLPRLLGLWSQLAEHYQNRPDDVILELFNEPNDAFTSELWNAYLPQIIDTIRTHDANRTLMVGTAPWGGIDGLDNLQLPADSNLIVTVHYYNPFQFTHQGAEWSDGSEAWLGTTWGHSDADFVAMQMDLNRVKSWSLTHNRPLNIGEFGSYYRAEMASRHLWTRSVVLLCENLDISWTYWEFAAGFGAYDRELLAWNDLLRALIVSPN